MAIFGGLKKMQTKAAVKQIVTQFELSNLIRKCKLFNKVKLAPSTRLVLESLVYHYPNIKVNIKTIEEETGNSRRSVDNALSELKTKGLIITIQTGRSSIFKLTQSLFDLLEVAQPTCKKEPIRHAEVAFPCNKENKKEINKPSRDFSNQTNPSGFRFGSEGNENKTRKIKDLLERNSFLSNKQQAEIVLNAYHQHNTKEQDYKTILQIKNIWKFKTEKFEILKHFEERKQTDMIFRKKIEHLEFEISDLLENYLNQIIELRKSWEEYMPDLNN